MTQKAFYKIKNQQEAFYIFFFNLKLNQKPYFIKTCKNKTAMGILQKLLFTKKIEIKN